MLLERLFNMVRTLGRKLGKPARLTLYDDESGQVEFGTYECDLDYEVLTFDSVETAIRCVREKLS